MLLDLRQAVVVVSPLATPRERKAAQVLVEEVQRAPPSRCRSRPPGRQQAAPSSASPASARCLAAGRHRPPPDLPLRAPRASRSRSSAVGGAASVAVAGADERGVLFGVGRLLRELRLGRGAIGAGVRPAPVDDAPDAPARTPARLPPQDQLVRRLDGRDVGPVHPRPGGVRHQRDRADSAAVRRRRRQPAFHVAADRDDGRDVAHRRQLRPRRLDLVSGARQGLRRPGHRGRGREGMGRGLQAAAARRCRPGARRRPGPHRAAAHVRAARTPDEQPAPVPSGRHDVAVAAGLHRGLDEPVLRLDGDATRPG